MKDLKNIAKSDIFSHWINISYLPRGGVLLLDLLIVLVAFIISYLIGSGLLTYDLQYTLPLWEQAACVVAVQTISFWVFHTYSGILRYSTFVDTMKVAISVCTTGIILLIINLVSVCLYCLVVYKLEKKYSGIVFKNDVLTHLKEVEKDCENYYHYRGEVRKEII